MAYVYLLHNWRRVEENTVCREMCVPSGKMLSSFWGMDVCGQSFKHLVWSSGRLGWRAEGNETKDKGPVERPGSKNIFKNMTWEGWDWQEWRVWEEYGNCIRVQETVSGTLSSRDTDPNKMASGAGYIVIRLPQKPFTLFCKLLGGSQRHFLGEINQFVEGGLQNQTLKTKKAKPSVSAITHFGGSGGWFVSGPPQLKLLVYDLSLIQGFSRKLSVTSTCPDKSKRDEGMLWIRFPVT